MRLFPFGLFWPTGKSNTPVQRSRIPTQRVQSRAPGKRSRIPTQRVLNKTLEKLRRIAIPYRSRPQPRTPEGEGLCYKPLFSGVGGVLPARAIRCAAFSVWPFFGNRAPQQTASQMRVSAPFSFCASQLLTWRSTIVLALSCSKQKAPPIMARLSKIYCFLTTCVVARRFTTQSVLLPR